MTRIPRPSWRASCTQTPSGHHSRIQEREAQKLPIMMVSNVHSQKCLPESNALKVLKVFGAVLQHRRKFILAPVQSIRKPIDFFHLGLQPASGSQASNDVQNFSKESYRLCHLGPNTMSRKLQAKASRSLRGCAAIAFIFIYSFGYALFFNAMVWVVPVELLPFFLRSKGLGLAVLSKGVVAIALPQFTPKAIEHVHW